MSRQDVKELIDIIEKEIKNVDTQAFATPVGGYRYIEILHIWRESLERYGIVDCSLFLYILKLDIFFRRGKEENGDLDIIIASHHLQHGTDQFLQKIVTHLSEKGIYK